MKSQHIYYDSGFCSGLWYLHENNVVHGDIKPGNILLNEDVTAVKLCDFGISRIKTRIQQTTTSSYIRGTVIYMAPETCLKNIKPNFQTDVWCAGATMLEILLRKELWQVPQDADLLEFLTEKMTQQQQPAALTALKEKDKTLFRKVQRALEYDAAKRATAKELYEMF